MSRNTKNTVSGATCAPAPHPTRETGAMRESIGTKINTVLVPFELITCAAVGLNYGEEKYGARNWEKGLNMSDLLNSVDRHNRAIMAGAYYDEDSGLPHHMLLASSVAMLAASIERGIAAFDIPPPAEMSIDTAAKRAQNYLDQRVLPQTSQG